MQTPILTHTSFGILSGLTDGQPRTLGELRARIGWQFSSAHLIGTISRLHQAGLVTKADIQKSGKRIVQITREGIGAWRECADFYRGLLDRFTPNDGPAMPKRLAGVRAVKPKGPGLPDRLPSQVEMRRMLAHAPIEFARIYPLIRELEVPPADVAALQISEINRHDMTITVGGRLFQVQVGQMSLIREAIGFRGAGPVFLSPARMAWTDAELSRVFRECRSAAGLPENVKIRGRKDCWKHRKNLRPSLALLTPPELA